MKRRSRKIVAQLIVFVFILAALYLQLDESSPAPVALGASATGSIAAPGRVADSVSTPDREMGAASQNDAWWQTYFVSPVYLSKDQAWDYGENGVPQALLSGSVAEALIARIDAAQQSIAIAAFETDMVDLADALIRAHDRGVVVRWITDDEFGTAADSEDGHGQIARMQTAGIDFRDDGRSGLMHNKFWIFDEEIVWTGSTNATISGMFQQDNNAIAITSPELAHIYTDQFDSMWRGQFGANAPSDIAGQSVNIQGSEIQVLFSPEDDAVSWLVPYIQSAQESIRFMAFSFTHDTLSSAMALRAAEGVVVVGVFESTGSYTQYSELSPFYCLSYTAGLSNPMVEVSTDGNPSFMHHKVIIIDDHTVITGSLNFSNNANKNNNENVLVIQNEDIVAEYVREFDRVAGFSQAPDASEIQCGP